MHPCAGGVRCINVLGELGASMCWGVRGNNVMGELGASRCWGVSASLLGWS